MRCNMVFRLERWPRVSRVCRQCRWPRPTSAIPAAIDLPPHERAENDRDQNQPEQRACAVQQRPRGHLTLAIRRHSAFIISHFLPIAYRLRLTAYPHARFPVSSLRLLQPARARQLARLLRSGGKRQVARAVQVGAKETRIGSAVPRERIRLPRPVRPRLHRRGRTAGNRRRRVEQRRSHRL